MGLDMYLYASKYENCYSCKEGDGFEAKKNSFYPEELKGFMEDDLFKTTTYTIGYWRKANAIHKWFIENCANGIDNCRKVYVGYNQLEELKSLVDKVLENHNLAKELLPVQDGFFFGSQEYDEWYFEDLKYTQDLLEKALKLDALDYDFYYEASW